jgi:hypothetical protein
VLVASLALKDDLAQVRRFDCRAGGFLDASD